MGGHPARLPALSAVRGVEGDVSASPVPGRMQIPAVKGCSVPRRVVAHDVHRVAPTVPDEQLLRLGAGLRQDEALVVEEVPAVTGTAPHNCNAQGCAWGRHLDWTLSGWCQFATRQTCSANLDTEALHTQGSLRFTGTILAILPRPHFTEHGICWRPRGK